MHLRRSAATALLLVLVAGLFPTGIARAALPAPVLVAPLGGTAASPDVELRWERVPGAVAYQLEVFHGDPAGTLLHQETTVNDRWIGRLPLAGGTAWWQVSAIDGDGVTGPAAHATFTTANPAPEPLWPPNGATVNHPAETPVLAWRSAYDYDQVFADQDLDATDPPTDNLGWIRPGTWRWRPVQMQGMGGPLVAASGETRTFTYAWPDSAPSLVGPVDGTHVAAATPFRLEWSHVPGANAYAWEVLDANRQVVAGTGDPTGIGPIIATWADVTAFLEPGAYTWRVRGRIAGTEMSYATYGDWSAERALTVDPWPVPAGTEPADGATLETWPLLRWPEIPGAEQYELHVAVDPGSAPITLHPHVAAYAFGAADISGSLANAAPGTATRWWRVRAITTGRTGYQTAGDWGAWRSFTVDPPNRQLGAPVAADLVSPADCSATGCALPGAPILRWGAVDGARFYRVFVSWTGVPADGFASRDVAGTAMPMDAWYAPTPEPALWGVVACAEDATCPDTMPATFRHLRLGLPAPAVLGPADGTVIEGPAVSLSWEPVAAPPADVLVAPVSYKVRSTPVVAGETRTTSTVSVRRFDRATLEGIADAATVTWQVRAEMLGPGLVSPWSTPRAFTRDEPPLQVLGPDPGTPQDPIPVMSWAAPGYTASGYDVQLTRADDDAIWPGYYRWRLGGAGTSVRPAFPLPPGEYRWRVRRGFTLYHIPQEGNGEWATGTFTVAGDPDVQLLEPAAGATVRADGAVLAWSPMPEANESELQTPGYVVQIGQAPDITWDTAIYRYFTASTRHAVTIALPEGPLYWRVCTALACTPSATLSTGASAVRMMLVTPPPVADTVAPLITAAPAITLATGGAAGGSQVVVRAAWSATDAGTGIDHHVLEVSRDGGAYVARGTALAAPSATLTLASGHHYRVRVRAVDRAGNSGAWSASRSFGVTARQESSSAVRWAGTWRRRVDDRFWGRTLRSSGTAGATATTTFTGRAVAWVADVGPGRGSARVYVDGKAVATISLTRPAFAARRIAWTRHWASTGTHTVRVRVLGTPAGNPRVDVDGFEILR